MHYLVSSPNIATVWSSPHIKRLRLLVAPVAWVGALSSTDPPARPCESLGSGEKIIISIKLSLALMFELEIFGGTNFWVFFNLLI